MCFVVPLLEIFHNRAGFLGLEITRGWTGWWCLCIFVGLGICVPLRNLSYTHVRVCVCVCVCVFVYAERDGEIGAVISMVKIMRGQTTIL